MSWQPIETAPKNGTWILLRGGSVDTSVYNPDVVGPMNPAVVAFWHIWDFSQNAEWAFSFWDGEWYSSYDNPTHWMPLPSDP